MAMVSINKIRPFGIACVVLMSGCASMGQLPSMGSMPESAQQVATDSSAATTDSATISKVTTEGDNTAFLPQQEYTAEGNKITYQQAPNPYLQQNIQVPEAARKAFAEADRKMKKGDYREARNAFRAITRDYPKLSGPWVKLGQIADIREDKEKAEKSFKKAIEVNPANINAYIALALHQRRKGDFDGAHDTYMAALQVWKDCPDAHLNLAILYDLYLNKPEMAQPHYEAYDFLVGGKNQEVKDWLAEIRRRTGIEKSFIDNPPQRPVAESGGGSNETETKPDTEEKG